ncbi:MAG: hypothetical protein M3463_03995 [Verrucomicrobiota bacterium]|nr:hypothetical protein [Verrucomicrobiota bacterium]
MTPPNAVNDSSSTREVLVALNRGRMRAAATFHSSSDHDPLAWKIETADHELLTPRATSCELHQKHGRKGGNNGVFVRLAESQPHQQCDDAIRRTPRRRIIAGHQAKGELEFVPLHATTTRPISP